MVFKADSDWFLFCAVLQYLIGISFATYSAAPGSYNTAIKQSVAQSIKGCYTSFVDIVSVGPSSTTTARRLSEGSSFRRLDSQTNNITIVYNVNANIPGSNYTTLTNQLNYHVANGDFNYYLGQNGQANGVTGFYRFVLAPNKPEKRVFIGISTFLCFLLLNKLCFY